MSFVSSLRTFENALMVNCQKVIQLIKNDKLDNLIRRSWA